MTVPLVILAVGSIFTGWLGAPEYLWGSIWDEWLQPIFGGDHGAEHGPVTTEILVTLITLAVVAVGIYLAYLKYGRAEKARASSRRSATWDSTGFCSTVTRSMKFMIAWSCGRLLPPQIGWREFLILP